MDSGYVFQIVDTGIGVVRDLHPLGAGAKKSAPCETFSDGQQDAVAFRHRLRQVVRLGPRPDPPLDLAIKTQETTIIQQCKQIQLTCLLIIIVNFVIS